MARQTSVRVPAPCRLEWRIDVATAADLPGSHEIAVSLILPRDFGRTGAGTVLCCLPGGSLSRRYWDLEVDGDRRFSFAEFMAARGFATVAIDHLGVGESSRPADGAAPDLLRLARANQAALERALERLRTGDARAGVRPTGRLRSVGVGHSMGSCMTVVQQAHHAPHAAIVLLSFTTRGLPHFLTEAELRFAGDPSGARAALPELVRARFGTSYPPPPSGAGREAAYGVGTAPPDALRALQRATTNLAAGPGILSMIPGAFAPEAQAIRVPVFLAVGDHDLHRADHASGEFPGAPEVVAYTLPDCWHCHNVANSRERLWARIARWIDESTRSP
jgi:alpha-beta hydrolase superfamily lysophospholipase